MTISAKKLKKNTPQAPTIWRVLEQGGFVLTLVVFFWAGKNTGVRVMGFSMLVFACHCLFVRRIPYGVEGQEPIGYLTGILAIFCGLIALGIAIFMILKPALVLDIFH
ncbi:MAG: hypothetical protein HY254_07960 [Burkholderiales bacterium]|nr:hypothetical protein [Burkholderiales bacterium]